MTENLHHAFGCLCANCIASRFQPSPPSPAESTTRAMDATPTPTSEAVKMLVDYLDSVFGPEFAGRAELQRLHTAVMAEVYPHLAAVAPSSEGREAAPPTQAEKDRDELIAVLADIVAKGTDYGQQDGGFVAAYILPTGPVHRAIPLLERLGVVVRPGFDGRKPLTEEQQRGVEEFSREMTDSVIPSIIADRRAREEAWNERKHKPLAAPRESMPRAAAPSIAQRMSDLRSGYSSGYADAKAGEDMQDEVSAARFLNLPVWNVEVCYYDVAATDDDGYAHHDATVTAPDEETAVETVENALRIRVPSAHILGERTTAKREGQAYV